MAWERRLQTEGSGLVGMNDFIRYQAPETLLCDEPWHRLRPLMKNSLPQNLQAHALVISHSKTLVARGGREVPPTNHETYLWHLSAEWLLIQTLQYKPTSDALVSRAKTGQKR